MLKGSLYEKILEDSSEGIKKLAVLIDPDQVTREGLMKTINLSVQYKIDYFFVGGSLIMEDCLDFCLQMIKEHSDIPAVIFPGNDLQINEKADAILYLSLISGRNPDFLIGKHVVSAPLLAKTNIEVVSTGYMLIDSGAQTTASYISNTQPIPSNKPNIAISTAMAGELLGLKLIFMDGGSGAMNPVSKEMINAVKSKVNVPVIIGGGIRSKEKVKENFDAGADIVVIGNAIEKDAEIIKEIAGQRY